MTSEPIASRLRTLRKKSGLTQAELAEILGFNAETPISEHERSQVVPNLLTAMAYEVIFGIPISHQFLGLFEAVEASVEIRLAQLEKRLQDSEAKGRDAILTARKLEFLHMRQEPDATQSK
jgi:transcriptional regulator with XRE-family HTH domain